MCLWTEAVLWAVSDAGVKTDLQLAEQSCVSSGCAWLGFSSSPSPGFWRAGDPLSPLIRLRRGVIVGSGSSLEWPSHTEKSLISFVPEVNFFFFSCKALEQAGVAIPGSVQKNMWTPKLIISFLFQFVFHGWGCFLQERQAGESH